jgi:hypothetical protein
MLVKADAWLKHHILKFALDKFKLLYFTNLKAPLDPLVFYGPREEFNPEIEYLGMESNPI